jgi:hypothetical protein
VPKIYTLGYSAYEIGDIKTSGYAEFIKNEKTIKEEVKSFENKNKFTGK